MLNRFMRMNTPPHFNVGYGSWPDGPSDPVAVDEAIRDFVATAEDVKAHVATVFTNLNNALIDMPMDAFNYNALVSLMRDLEAERDQWVSGEAYVVETLQKRAAAGLLDQEGWDAFAATELGQAQIATGEADGSPLTRLSFVQVWIDKSSYLMKRARELAYHMNTETSYIADFIAAFPAALEAALGKVIEAAGRVAKKIAEQAGNVAGEVAWGAGKTFLILAAALAGGIWLLKKSGVKANLGPASF